MTTLKPVEETVKEIPTDYETMVGSVSNQRYYRQMTVINALTQDRQAIYTALKEGIEGAKSNLKFDIMSPAYEEAMAEQDTWNQALDRALTILDELFAVSK